MKLNDPPVNQPMPFIVGVSRSGTTLLRFLLDAHPEMAIPPETHWLKGVIKMYSCGEMNLDDAVTIISGHSSWPDMNISHATLEMLLGNNKGGTLAEFVRAIYKEYAAKFGAKRFGDKTPDNILNMKNIAMFFPEARFIHIIRDGRDIAVSHKGTWFGPKGNVRKAAKHWSRRILTARKQALSLDHYLEVRYEDLLLDTESVLQKISAFIDLPIDQRQFKYYEDSNDRLVKEMGERKVGKATISANQRVSIHKMVSQPPDPRRINRWKLKLTQNEVAIFEAVAGKLLKELGYVFANEKIGFVLRLKLLLRIGS